MQVLIFLRCLGVGGAENQALLMADRLNRRGHLVSITTLHVIDKNWQSLPNADRVSVQVLYSRTPRGILEAGFQLVGAALKLRRLLKDDEIQLVYTMQGTIGHFVAWLATRRLPETRLVWGVRGSKPQESDSRSDWKSRLLSRLGRWVAPSVPLTISNSEAGHVLAARNYRCQKHIVVFNGIDVDRFRPDPQGRARVRAEWNIPANQMLIGLVGRLAPEKDHPTFLHAAARLAAGCRDVRFVLVGDGSRPYRERLLQLSGELGLEDSLVWAGTRSDMPAVYSALDVLCLASFTYEGFPNVVAEAMACGVPCVVTNVGDSALIVGELGIVVPRADPQALAAGLGKMLEGLDAIQPHRLRQRIVSRFSVETMVVATERALLEAYDRGG